MKERPIIFSAPMVRAILDGRKTQTRRVVKPQPQPQQGMVNAGYCGHPGVWLVEGNIVDGDRHEWECPYGQPGDRLWVRESFWKDESGFKPTLLLGAKARVHVEYDADMEDHDREESRRADYKRKPSIHMPRWASRIMLEITGVRVERLQSISDGDAYDEGILEWASAHAEKLLGAGHKFASAGAAFSALWESINGKGSWATNPWVWVIEFRLIQQEAKAA